MLVAQNSLGPVCPVPLTVRGSAGGANQGSKEIVAALLACRPDQILPAIEDYLYKQKGLARGDVD